MVEKSYLVEGIHCAHCKHALESQVGKVDGVTRVAVDVDSKTVSVFGEAAGDAAIRDAIEAAGYHAA